MAGARHDQAVSMLTGLERFVRLVCERIVDARYSDSESHNSVSPSVASTKSRSYMSPKTPPPAPPQTPPKPAPRKLVSQSSSISSDSESVQVNLYYFNWYKLDIKLTHKLCYGIFRTCFHVSQSKFVPIN